METRVKTVFTAVFECSMNDIKDGFSKDTVGSWDSLKHLILIAALEEEFSVSFEPDEILSISTYSEAVRVIQTKI